MQGAGWEPTQKQVKCELPAVSVKVGKPKTSLPFPCSPEPTCCAHSAPCIANVALAVSLQNQHL